MREEKALLISSAYPERPGVEHYGRSLSWTLRLTDYRAVPVFTGRMRLLVPKFRDESMHWPEDINNGTSVPVESPLPESIQDSCVLKQEEYGLKYNAFFKDQ